MSMTLRGGDIEKMVIFADVEREREWQNLMKFYFGSIIHVAIHLSSTCTPATAVCDSVIGLRMTLTSNLYPFNHSGLLLLQGEAVSHTGFAVTSS